MIRNGAGAAVREISRSNNQLIPDAPTESVGDRYGEESELYVDARYDA